MSDTKPSEATMLVLGDRILEGFAADGSPLIHDQAALRIEAGHVVEIGPAAALRARFPDAAIMGGAGKVIMPGLINAHHHVGLTPFQLGSPDYPWNSGSPRGWRCGMSIFGSIRCFQPSR